MLHEYGHHHVHQYELCHKDENNEEYRCNDATDATVFNAVGRVVAVIPQGVLHYAVPIVPGRDSE